MLSIDRFLNDIFNELSIVIPLISAPRNPGIVFTSEKLSLYYPQSFDPKVVKFWIFTIFTSSKETEDTPDNLSGIIPLTEWSIWSELQTYFL